MYNPNLPSCTLCTKNPADKSGSHIIPHFLIKSMVNENNSKGRDKEISHLIGGIAANTFFGRQVTPESIDEVLGRDLTDEELEHNINHYVKDNFLCTACEKRLSVLESYYAENESKITDYQDCQINQVNSGMALLFWASILWRISITNFGGLKLVPKEKDKLRRLLDLVLNEDIEQILQNIQKHRDLISIFNYVVLIDSADTDPTSFFVFINPFQRRPYSIVLNKHVLFFYFKKSHFHQLEQDFFGYEKLINSHYLNPTDSTEIVCKIPLTISEKAKTELLAFKSSKMISQLQIQLNNAFRQNFPEIPHNILFEITSEIITEYIMGETIGQRYSANRFNAIIMDVFLKHIGQNQ